MRNEVASKHLWGYTFEEAGARAFLLALTGGNFTGHERFFILAPTIGSLTPTEELVKTWFPNAEIRKPLPDNTGVIDCSKAERLLGWKHDQEVVTN